MVSEMSMRERIARALCLDEYDGGYLSGAEIEACIEEDMKTSRRDVFFRKADAVIAALREPDNAILQAGYEAMFTSKWDGTQAPMMGAGWDAMIDAALEDKERG